MRLRAVLAVALTIIGLSGVTGSTLDSVPSSVHPVASVNLASCKVPGLALAPKLTTSPDLTSGGASVAISPSSSRDGSYVAVLTIPGLDGIGAHSDARTGAFSHPIDLSTAPSAASLSTSLIGELQGIQGAAVYTFDYRAAAGKWITDARIAPAIGTAIDCLYKLTGQKVILVTQSTGALAARLALGTRGSGAVARSAEVSTVAAFGAPTTGSSVSAALNGVGAATSESRGLLSALSAYCEGRTDAASMAFFCGAWPSNTLFAAAAARDLEPGSAALAAVPAWPAGVRVTSLAGDVQFTVAGSGWFFDRSNDAGFDVGDFLTDQDSAVEGATTRSIALCRYQLSATATAKGQIGFSVAPLDTSVAPATSRSLASTASPCFSGELTRSLQLTAAATAAVKTAIAAQLPVFHQLSAGQFLSPFGDGIAFDSPSHNIHCGYEGSSEDGYNIGCVLVHYTFKNPPDVHDCEADAIYGGGFYMENGIAAPICTQSELWAGQGQTVRALPYDSEVVYEGYTFICEKTGVTVIDNANGHGFKVDYEAYHTF